MQSRLEAEEAIAGANETAVGTGSLKKDARRVITSAWERAAAVRPAGRPAAPTVDGLRPIGIRMRAVPVRH